MQAQRPAQVILAVRLDQPARCAPIARPEDHRIVGERTRGRRAGGARDQTAVDRRIFDKAERGVAR